MKNIGGELCLKDEDSKIFFTNSGRSSLRLFLRNIDKNKKILIPNFLCEVIVKILEEEVTNIQIDFIETGNSLIKETNSVFSICNFSIAIFLSMMFFFK